MYYEIPEQRHNELLRCEAALRFLLSTEDFKGSWAVDANDSLEEATLRWLKDPNGAEYEDPLEKLDWIAAFKPDAY